MPKIIPEELYDDAADFWKYVPAAMLGDDSICWEWAGLYQPYPKKIEVPYGDYCGMPAHRVSFYVTTGIQPGSKVVCHSCDNPACVNPSHLFLGTSLDNARDMVAKGRQWTGDKPRKQPVRLSDGQVIEIFLARASISELSRLYNVARFTISSIRGRRTHGNLTKDLIAPARLRYSRHGMGGFR